MVMAAIAVILLLLTMQYRQIFFPCSLKIKKP